MLPFANEHERHSLQFHKKISIVAAMMILQEEEEEIFVRFE
jgi:hypothetical protein